MNFETTTVNNFSFATIQSKIIPSVKSQSNNTPNFFNIIDKKSKITNKQKNANGNNATKNSKK